MARDLVCIICPRGCHLHVDDDLNVTGNFCPRGEAYGKQEVSDPRRVLTTTMRIDSSLGRVISVKTSKDIRKDMIFKVMKIVNQTRVSAPIHLGDVLISNVADSGADIIATQDMLQ